MEKSCILAKKKNTSKDGTQIFKQQIKFTLMNFFLIFEEKVYNIYKKYAKWFTQRKPV